MLTITRRTAIQSLAASALLRAASPKATAFALVGDRYHNSDYMRTGLGKLSSATPESPSISPMK